MATISRPFLAGRAVVCAPALALALASSGCAVDLAVPGGGAAAGK